MLQSDHKPLIPLINNKSLLDAPVRCQRLLMSLFRYSPKAEYIPGKYMVVADTLSRDVKETETRVVAEILRGEVREYEIQAVSSLPLSETLMQEIIRNQHNDEFLSRVIAYTMRGWPEDVDSDLVDYFGIRGEFSVISDLLIRGNRIVIPVSLRQGILSRIHNDGHLSLQKCRRRIQDSVWWPRVSSELS